MRPTNSRTLFRAGLAALLLMPAAALAQPGPPDDMGPPDGMGPPHAERRAEAQQRIRTMRAVALANALGLDEKTALAKNSILTSYDEKRDALREKIHADMKAIEEAAQADAPDAKSVDRAIASLEANRNQMHALQHEEAAALMKGLTPKQKAQLVIFLREFPKEVRKAMRHRREKRQRMRRMQGPPDGEW